MGLRPVLVTLLTFLLTPALAVADCCQRAGDCIEGVDAFNCAVEFGGSIVVGATCDESTGLCGGGGCVDGAGCSDGNACTEGDACSGGQCTGTPVSCDDALSCTTDGCDPGTGCTHDVDPGLCLIAGACVAAGAANPANACQQCTPAVAVTAWSPVSDAASCSDGNACNGVGTCTAGTCVAGTAVECDTPPTCRTATGATCSPGTGTCTYPALSDGASCSDGNVCNGAETCAAGTCAPGTAVPCTTPPACRTATGATCNPASGTCVYPTVADGTSCSDGNVCNGAETCAAGTCAPGTAVPCTTPPACRTATNVTCNPETGTCIYPALQCNTPPACRTTTGATCSPETGTCVYPTAADSGTLCSLNGGSCNGLCIDGECSGIEATGTSACAFRPFWTEAAGCASTTAVRPTVSGAAASVQLDPPLFYRVRDLIFHGFAGGRRATELYYRHTGEIARLLVGERALYALGKQALLAWQPGLMALDTGRPDTVTAAQVQALTAFLDALRPLASPVLAAAIDRGRARLAVETWSGMAMTTALAGLDRFICTRAATTASAICRIDDVAEVLEIQAPAGSFTAKLAIALARARGVIVGGDSLPAGRKQRAAIKKASKLLAKIAARVHSHMGRKAITDEEVRTHITDPLDLVRADLKTLGQH